MKITAAEFKQIYQNLKGEALDIEDQVIEKEIMQVSNVVQQPAISDNMLEELAMVEQFRSIKRQEKDDESLSVTERISGSSSQQALQDHTKVLRSSDNLDTQFSDHTFDKNYDSEDSPLFETPSTTSEKGYDANYSSSNPRRNPERSITSKEPQYNIKSYSSEMMGGFRLSFTDENLIVSEDSIIRRPNKVKGYLGDIAGDHVIAFAFMTKAIEIMVRGEKVDDALDKISIMFGGKQVDTSQDDQYYLIFDNYRKQKEKWNDDSEIIQQVKKFEYLRSMLIPHCVAAWNNEVRSAYISYKTQKERGIEGARVRELLPKLMNVILESSQKRPASAAMDSSSSSHSAEFSASSDNENIKNFIKIIDYKPVNNDRLSFVDSNNLPLLQHRTNHVDELCQVMGDVVETYCFVYDVSEKHQLDITKKLVEELFKQNKWLNYFKKNPNALGGAGINEKKIKQDQLVDYICEKIFNDGKSFLVADALSVTSGSEVAGNPNSQGTHTSLIELEDDQVSYTNKFPDKSGSQPSLGISDAINIESNHEQNVLGIKRSREKDDNRSSKISKSDEADDDNANLKRSEKRDIIAVTKQAKPKFIEILTKDLSELERELIGRLKTEKETEVPSTKTTAQKTSLKPQITLMAENDHKIDHRDNTTKLIEMVNANQIDSSTVICLERKEEGKNFGMRDVRLLARLLEHNQANPESMVPINEQVQKSPIYQDAMLYNVAKEKGIQVIGVEGKGLKHAKESPEYNSTREDYMASQITKIIASGKNVIFPVGASHIDSLKSKFPDALDMVVSINEGILPESANMSSSGLKQEMSQLKKPSSYILIDTAHISSPKVTPILYESKLSNLTK